MEKLLGVVLCGGKSSRMGTDKGLIKRGEKTWAAVVAERFNELSIPFSISINPRQQEAYKQIFPDTPLLVDDLDIDGPLEGLLTVHKSYPDKDLLLLACDLIDMDSATIESIVTVYHSEPDFDFYAFEQNGFIQTFGAIYTASGLAKAYQKFESKELKKYSLHDRFSEGSTRLIPLSNPAAFNNYNHPVKE